MFVNNLIPEKQRNHSCHCSLVNEKHVIKALVYFARIIWICMHVLISILCLLLANWMNHIRKIKMTSTLSFRVHRQIALPMSKNQSNFFWKFSAWPRDKKQIKSPFKVVLLNIFQNGSVFWSVERIDVSKMRNKDFS